MPLQDELDFLNPVADLAHETIMSIVLTGEMLAKEADRILKPLKLTQAQFNVLMLLRFQSEKGEVNQTRLGRMLLVNRSNVTGLVDRMERDGWVMRVAEPGDRRVKKVRMTEVGRKLCDKAAKAYFERVHELVSSHSAQAQKDLCRRLDEIRSHIHEKAAHSLEPEA